MTHLTLHRSLSASINEQVAELFSTAILALTSLFGLVALATLVAI